MTAKPYELRNGRRKGMERLGHGVENIQLHLAWRYGQEGKTFDEFMDSFTQPVPYVKWGDRI